jgi:hypothetical protein
VRYPDLCPLPPTLEFIYFSIGTFGGFWMPFYSLPKIESTFLSCKFEIKGKYEKHDVETHSP